MCGSATQADELAREQFKWKSGMHKHSVREACRSRAAACFSACILVLLPLLHPCRQCAGALHIHGLAYATGLCLTRPMASLKHAHAAAGAVNAAATTALNHHAADDHLLHYLPRSAYRHAVATVGHAAAAVGRRKRCERAAVGARTGRCVAVTCNRSSGGDSQRQQRQQGQQAGNESSGLSPGLRLDVCRAACCAASWSGRA